MHLSRSIWTVLAVFCFFFSIAVSGSASNEQAHSTVSGAPAKLGAGLVLNVRHHHRGTHQPSFLQNKSSSEVVCESDCCWAWADCEGSRVTCSELYCGASCGDGQYAEYICEE
jgi:hypothetical protein